MESYQGAISISVAQTDDVCGVEVKWSAKVGGEPWVFEGSSKRRAGDKRDLALGRNLALLRAVRKLVRRLEREIGPEAYDKADMADTPAAFDALAKLTDDLRPGDLVTCEGTANTAKGFGRSNLFVWTGGDTVPNARWFDSGAPCWLSTSGGGDLVKVATADAHKYLYKPEPVAPAPTFQYDPDSFTLHLSREGKKSLLEWLELWRTTYHQGPGSVVAEMIQSVRGTVTDG